MVRWLHFFVCAILLSTTHLSFAQESNTSPSIEESFSKPDQMQAALIFEEETIQPGHPFWVGVHLKLKDKWHSYWKNPGDAGMAPVMEWSLPEGFSVGPVMWPVPQKFSVNGVIGLGYEGEPILLAQIIPPQSIASESADIGVKLRWVVCSDSECVIGESETNGKRLIAADEPKVSHETKSLFSQARERLPQKYANAEAIRSENFIELKIQLPNDSADHSKAHVVFYPEENNLIDQSIDPTISPQTDLSQNHYAVTLKIADEQTKSQQLKGVLVFQDNDKKQVSHAFDIEAQIIDKQDTTFIGMIDLPQKAQYLTSLVGATASKFIHPDAEFNGGLGLALLLAFVGGMILNLMPCVLPVISFKILSFVKLAGQSRSLTFKHGLAFSLGVLISFWVLAGILLVLQTYGHAVGWGFQLQEPLFVGILAALLLIFSLSMFGIFEIGTSVTSLAGQATSAGSRSVFFGSFLSGVLATAVATPCTGPFLGTAVGYAVTLPAALSLLIFTSLGLGMAFPYLLLAAFPKLLRFLPKPGSWMVTFKELMGFVMLASVLWLVWVFGAQTGSESVFFLLAGFFCLALGCWIYGKWGSSLSSRASRTFGILFAASCFLAGGYIIIHSTSWPVEQEAGSQEIAHVEGSEWEAFSPARIAELQSQGKPVIVDFTAKWCLICQANHLVLTSDDVDQKFNDLGVVRMKADWTKRDAVITEALRQYGRNSVPLYLLYGPDPTKPPEILPQVLTPDIVLEHLKNMENGIVVSSEVPSA